jgi:diguanylate cyclase (GGDEF)-like protein
LPAVALDVLRISRERDVSAGELAKVIQNDPVISARILKIVNSSLFGIPRKIGSIQQAVVVLGIRSVKVMALSFSLVDAMGDATAKTFDLTAFWRRCLTTAVTARLLGRAVAKNVAEEAFVAGLLTDIGMMAAWRCAPVEYGKVTTILKKTGKQIQEAEQQVFNTTHAEMSKAMLSAWGLPDEIVNSVACHHGDGLDQLEGTLLTMAKIVNVAAEFSSVFCEDIPWEHIDEIKSNCIRNIGIDLVSLETILESLSEHVSETASMLALNVGKTLDYGQLREEAAQQLAQLSLQAEMERTVVSRKEQEARTEVQRLNEERRTLIEVASTDGLTSIANRAAFDARIDEEISKAKAERSSLGLIMLDIDHFKSFNDNHGHQAGDEVLRRVAKCLRREVRGVGFVSRYGGEEFAVILCGKDISTVKRLAEAIRFAIESTIVEYEGKTLRVTASLGASVVDYRQHSATPDQLINFADQRLYEAKKNGRNRTEAAIFGALKVVA